MKKLFTFILALGLILPALTLVFAEDTKESSNTVSRAVFQVENLTCGACFSKINQALEGLEGFAGMGANLWRKMVAVDFRAPLTAEDIGTAISKAGYPASLDLVDVLEEKETFAYMRSVKSGAYGGGCCAGGGQAGCSYGGKSASSKNDI